jgi:beta-phosphoglucomutase family hydrolase
VDCRGSNLRLSSLVSPWISSVRTDIVVAAAEGRACRPGASDANQSLRLRRRRRSRTTDDMIPSRKQFRDGTTTKIGVPIDRIDGVIFDMDGVVTDTARLHARCWKRVFDEYLRAHSETGETFRPFDEEDYLRYVDGKPRYDGVESFLSSRAITLEHGSSSDPPGYDTVCALGNLKDQDFEQAVREEGVTPFESTLTLLRSLRSLGISTALISSSRHARAILAAAGIANLFDVIVDGVDADTLGLPGKPDPAIFLTAARLLGIAPSRAVVVEDALSGVEAGHRGGFSFVIGIDRRSHADALRQHGADIVVEDLSDFELQGDSSKD